MTSCNLSALSARQQRTRNKEDEALKDPAKADYKAGRDFLKQGEYAQAAVSFHNALKGFEEQGDEQGIANASDRLGDVCLAKEEYTKAMEPFSTGLCNMPERKR